MSAEKRVESSELRHAADAHDRQVFAVGYEFDFKFEPHAVTGTPNGNDFTSGKTVAYAYNSSASEFRLKHDLLTITAPNEVAVDGPPRVVVTYDEDPMSADFGRVLYLDLGGTNASSLSSGGSISYVYGTMIFSPSSYVTSTVDTTAVTDRNGNDTEYDFNTQGNIVAMREYTDDSRIPRNSQPAYFETLYDYNSDHQLLEVILPLGNTITHVYDSGNAYRRSQGNLLSTTQTADGTRGGDQSQIIHSYTYEPLFNQIVSVTDPRGNDPSYTPPNGGSWSAARYTTTYTYDFQEGTDFAGLGAKLGLTATEVEDLLIAANIPMDLEDVNGDGVTDQINGNLIRVEQPTVTLLPNTNMASIEGTTSQPITSFYVYNSFGLLIESTDPEGNVNEYEYYTVASPGTGSFNSSDGGYLAVTIQDTTADAGRNSGTDPTPAFIIQNYEYDSVGNVVLYVDGRGITTEYVVNQLNQVVQVVRAAAVPGTSAAEPVPLTAHAFIQRYFFDYNNNVVLTQVEDRGNTSNVDGNLPSGDLPNVPGASNADPLSGTAFVDTAYHYDILDQQIKTVQEIANGGSPTVLTTNYRFDPNGHQVLTILPEGNAHASIYDERDLLFQSISGIDELPMDFLVHLHDDDPDTFDRAGGAGTTPTTLTHNYDGNSNLVESVDAVHNGGETSSIAGAGDVTTRVYDGFDRVKTTIDALGNETINTYDPASNVVRVIQMGEPVDDVAGDTDNVPLAITEYVHDELSRTIVTHQVVFLTPDNLPTRTPNLTTSSPMTGLAAYLPDASTNSAAVPGVSGITISGRISSLNEYDRNSRLVFSVDHTLHTYRTFYDGVGRTIKTLDSALNNGFSGGEFDPSNLAGNTVETAYDGNSNVIETKRTEVTTISGVSPQVFRTTNFYDSLNRLETFVDSFFQTIDQRHDSRGNLVAMTDAQGPITSRQLPRRGLGDTSSYTVNDFGNVMLITVDGLGRMLQKDELLTDDGLGDGSFIGADDEGIKISIPMGYHLDLTDGGGDGINSAYWLWDDNSELLAFRDDSGNTTGYIRDNLGRVTTQRNGLNVTGTSLSLSGGDSGYFNSVVLGGSSPVDSEMAGTDDVFDFDTDGNITVHTDQAGNVFTSTFDALGRKTSVSVSPAGTFVGTTLQEWTFDGLGRQTSSTDDTGAGAFVITINNFYDSLSRLVEESQEVGNTSAKLVSYNYDVDTSNSIWQPSSMIYPDGREVFNGYDNLDRLVFRIDAGAGTPIGVYEYIGPSRVATLTYQNGTRLTYIAGTTVVGYDAAQRIINHRWELSSGTLGSGTLVLGFGYTYDGDNLVLSQEKFHDPNNSEVYTYQSDNQLETFERGTLSGGVIVSPTTTSGVLQSQDWDVDGQGNWIESNTTIGGVTTTDTRDHTDFNEIDSRTLTTGTMSLGGSITYDKNGNMLDDGIRSYKWDAFNRLREVYRKSDDMLIAEFAYDAAGRRFEMTVHNGGLSGTLSNGATDYFYDGQRVIEERDSNDDVTQQYVYGNYLDEVWTLDNRRGGITVADLNDGSGSDRHFYHYDRLYSVYGLTNEDADLVEAYMYEPYGKQVVFTDGNSDGIVNFNGTDVVTVGGSSLVFNVNMFTGQRFDEATGLDYYKARYYDVELGRFISRDPVEDDRNLYRYVGNGPTNSTDPSGLTDVKIPLREVAKQWLANKGWADHSENIKKLREAQGLKEIAQQLIDNVKKDVKSFISKVGAPPDRALGLALNVLRLSNAFFTVVVPRGKADEKAQWTYRDTDPKVLKDGRMRSTVDLGVLKVTQLTKVGYEVKEFVPAVTDVENFANKGSTATFSFSITLSVTAMAYEGDFAKTFMLKTPISAADKNYNFIALPGGKE